MKLHALVADLQTAQLAVEGGASVVQLRLKEVSTEELVERGHSIGELCRKAGVMLVVNDDVEAARLLVADGVHLGRRDGGAERALRLGLILGLSAACVDEATAAERRGASYIGAGPVWTTPTKPDADPPIGLEGLGQICGAVSIPVVAIGGVDERNARSCIEAGAAGVAVVRAASMAGAVRGALGLGHAAV